MRLRFPVRRDTQRKDAVAGLVLGVESVPDGLAAGLLAGVSPLLGLYAYLFGTIGGSFFTSSAFMAVQATEAMAIVIAGVNMGIGAMPVVMLTLPITSVLLATLLLASDGLALMPLVIVAVVVAYVAAARITPRAATPAAAAQPVGQPTTSPGDRTT